LQKRKTRQGDNYIKNKAMRQPYKKKRKSKRRPQHMARRPPLNFPWAAKPQTTGGTSQKKKKENTRPKARLESQTTSGPIGPLALRRSCNPTLDRGCVA